MSDWQLKEQRDLVRERNAAQRREALRQVEERAQRAKRRAS